MSNTDPTPPRKGLFNALWTPVLPDGSIDRVSLRHHIGYLRGCGIDGLMVLGSTGEFTRLSIAAQKEIISAATEYSGSMFVVVNTSSTRLEQVIDLAAHAKQAGAHGVAIMPPYFFRLKAADIREFILRATEKIELPVCLYNYPEVTGNRIDPDVIADLTEQANIFGLKQSGAEFDYHHELAALAKEKNFTLFSAADKRLPEAFKIGARGHIGGLANMIPEIMKALYDACEAGDESQIATPLYLMSEVIDVISKVPFPFDVAAGMEARGFNPGHPKTVLSAESQATYRTAVGACRALYSKWELPNVEEAACAEHA